MVAQTSAPTRPASDFRLKLGLTPSLSLLIALLHEFFRDISCTPDRSHLQMVREATPVADYGLSNEPRFIKLERETIHLAAQNMSWLSAWPREPHVVLQSTLHDGSDEVNTTFYLRIRLGRTGEATESIMVLSHL